MSDWTDLQHLVELARHGSLSSAARALGVTHATVARRIAALEADFGRPLFKRDSGRYVPTAVGAHIVELAFKMEEPALGIVRAMAGRLPEVAGPVRITATDVIAQEFVMAAATRLHAAHPRLELDIIVSNDNLSLARRDADIALRLRRPTHGELYARKVADVAIFRYASAAYIEGKAESDYGYIGYCNVPPDIPEVAALEKLCTTDQIVMCTNQLPCRLVAVESGIGVGLLPKFIADGRPSMVQLDAEPVLMRDLWLVVHRDLRNTPRIRACIAQIDAAFKRRRKQLV